jgi:general secretion pathway protein C
MNKFATLLTLMLAALFCALLAFWFVRLRETSPPIVALTPEQSARYFDHAVQARLFGTSPLISLETANVDIRLAGVIAPSRDKDQGVAVLAVESKPMRAYRTGEQIAPGIQLLEVQPTRVFIGQNGARSEVRLPVTKTGLAPVN